MCSCDFHMADNNEENTQSVICLKQDVIHYTNNAYFK